MPSRSSRATLMLNLDQSGCPKFVAPPVTRTPSALAGPGVSSPTARTRSLGTPVIVSTLSKESTSAVMALSGPSRTRLGSSAISAIRNVPSASSTVPLFAVPPLSMPTVTQSPEVGMNPPQPRKTWPPVRGGDRWPGANEGFRLPLEAYGHLPWSPTARPEKSPRDRVVCAEGEHTRCGGSGEGADQASALPSTAGYRYADRHRALSGCAVLEDSPSPVYGAALLMRFGSDPIRGSNPRSSAERPSMLVELRSTAPLLAVSSRGDDPRTPRCRLRRQNLARGRGDVPDVRRCAPHEE